MAESYLQALDLLADSGGMISLGVEVPSKIYALAQGFRGYLPSSYISESHNIRILGKKFGQIAYGWQTFRAFEKIAEASFEQGYIDRSDLYIAGSSLLEYSARFLLSNFFTDKKFRIAGQILRSLAIAVGYGNTIEALQANKSWSSSLLHLGLTAVLGMRDSHYANVGGKIRGIAHNQPSHLELAPAFARGQSHTPKQRELDSPHIYYSKSQPPPKGLLSTEERANIINRLRKSLTPGDLIKAGNIARHPNAPWLDRFLIFFHRWNNPLADDPIMARFSQEPRITLVRPYLDTEPRSPSEAGLLAEKLIIGKDPTARDLIGLCGTPPHGPYLRAGDLLTREKWTFDGKNLKTGNRGDQDLLVQATYGNRWVGIEDFRPDLDGMPHNLAQLPLHLVTLPGPLVYGVRPYHFDPYYYYPLIIPDAEFQSPIGLKDVLLIKASMSQTTN